MWKPKISKFPHKYGNKTLLWKAFTLAQPLKFIEKLEDDKGTFAINTDRCVLVAKKYVYGYIVSAHKRAVISAFNQKKKLLMYIGNAKKFYVFDPKDILNNSMENIRGKEVMMNWNINLGRRFLTLNDGDEYEVSKM